MMIFGVASFAYLVTRRHRRTAVFIGSSPHLFAAFGTWMAAAVRRVPFVLEVRDLWPESYTAVSGKTGGSVVRLLRAMADVLYRHASQIVVLAEPNRQHIAARGVDINKIAYIPNGVDLDTFPINGRRPVAAETVFAYAGAHGPANGLEVVLLACLQLQEAGRDDIRVVLMGDGPAKPALVELAQSRALRNVELRDPMPKAMVPSFLAEVDVGLMILAPVDLFTYGVSPNKLFDYLGANLAVVNNVPGLVADLVTEAGAGINCASGDPSALAAAMAEAADLLSDDRAAFSSGREFVARNYERRTLARRLLGVLAVGRPGEA
jgi:glycosyltransferase involved in cell wall biosynthesis